MAIAHSKLTSRAKFRSEAIWVLDTIYELDSRSLATAIEMLLRHASLVLQDQDAVELVLTQFRAKPSLGFSDCLMLELAPKAGHLPLATFDRNLGKLEGAKRL